MNSEALQQLLAQDHVDVFELAHCCGGYYKTPYDAEGRRSGPLVGYAGKDENTGKQYVGEEYFNFAQVERRGAALDRVTNDLLSRLKPYIDRTTTFFAAPEGGKALATVLATKTEKDYVYPEKKVLASATESRREKSELVFNRHELQAGERIMIVEDVANNFSTTLSLLKMIAEAGAEVVGLVCVLNRSLKFDNVFYAHSFEVPVISLVRKKIDEYQQCDPFVAADVQAGNVAWKPKDGAQWKRLMEAMEAAK